MEGKVQVTDTEIRSEIRALVAQHRFDFQRIQFRVAGGTVRVCGELLYLGGVRTARVSGSVIGDFERDISRRPGVKHVSFDLENWRRLASGEWQPVLAKRPLAGSLTG